MVNGAVLLSIHSKGVAVHSIPIFKITTYFALFQHSPILHPNFFHGSFIYNAYNCPLFRRATKIKPPTPNTNGSRLFVLFHPTQPHPCKPHQIKQPLSKIAVFLSINESALPPPPPSSAKNVPITRGNVPKKHTFPRLIGIFPLYPPLSAWQKMGCGISLKDTTAFYGLLSTLERLNGGRW